MDRKLWIPIGILALLMMTLIIIGTGYTGPSFRLRSEASFPLNDQWVHVVDGENNEALDTLPTRLDLDHPSSYSIERVLGEPFTESQNLLVRTSLANLRVELEGVMIYSVDFSDELTYASTWHIIEIPEDSQGKTLKLTFDTPYRSMHGILNEVEYGSLTGLYADIFRDFGFRFVVGIGALIIGTLILLTSIFLLKDENQYNAYLGLFAIIMSIWLLSESRILQFFIGNPNILGSLSYITLSLIPIPIIVYMQKVFVIDYQRIFNLLIGAFTVNTGVILTLHFTRLLTFFESVVITMALIVLTILITLTVFIIEYRKYKSKNVLNVLRLSLVMAVFILIEIIVFSVSDFRRTSDYAAIALGLIILLILIGFIRFSISNYKGSLERSLYQKLAFTDQLTNAQNRYAYFERINQPCDSLQPGKCSLVYFDLDGLKAINDEHGHLIGDRAIIDAYKVINDVFGEYGTCYRMGGDEFVCLTKGLDQKQYQQKEKIFKERFSDINQTTPYTFSMSMGYAVYDEAQDRNLMDTLRRADQSMYLNKQSKRK